MEGYGMEVEKVYVVSTKSFSEVVATLERHVPTADMAVILRMIASRPSAQEIERAIGEMVREWASWCSRNWTKDRWSLCWGNQRR
jgi:hypothetical protein